MAVEVVVGEEISTRGGHLLGLWLTEPIKPWQSLRASIAAGPRAGRPGDPGPSAVPVSAVRPGRDAPAAARRAGSRLPSRRDRGLQPDDVRPAVHRRVVRFAETPRPGERRQQRRPRRRGDRTGLDDLPGPLGGGPAGGDPRPGEQLAGHVPRHGRAARHVRPAASQVRPRHPRRDPWAGSQGRHRPRSRLSRRSPAAAPSSDLEADRRSGDEDRPGDARTSTRSRAGSTSTSATCTRTSASAATTSGSSAAATACSARPRAT